MTEQGDEVGGELGIGVGEGEWAEERGFGDGCLHVLVEICGLGGGSKGDGDGLRGRVGKLSKKVDADDSGGVKVDGRLAKDGEDVILVEGRLGEESDGIGFVAGFCSCWGCVGCLSGAFIGGRGLLVLVHVGCCWLCGFLLLVEGIVVVFEGWVVVIVVGVVLGCGWVGLLAGCFLVSILDWLAEGFMGW